MKKIYVLLIATCFSLTLFAQTPKADRLFENWNYYRAAKLYEKEIARHPNADVYFKLGECYRKMNLYKQELAAYDKVNEAGVYHNPEFYLKYGEALRNNGKYNQAKIAFDKYIELIPYDMRGEFFRNSIDTILEDHKWDEPIKMSNVAPLNTNQADFCPVFYKDGIVFTSSRENTKHGKTYGWTGTNYLDIYYAKIGSSNMLFTDLTPFGGKIMSKKYHDGSICFSKNYDIAYVSQVQKYLKGEDKKTLQIERIKIFISTMKENKWTKAVPFFLNSDYYSVANPFLSEDGSRLYFVSDMPGGYGETDIYYCTREGDGWSKPINMGPNINTFNREKFPNMDAEGNFYFASDGYQGYGGLDICVALNMNGILAKAKPMKYPFNSSTDDYGIVFLKDGKTGYLSSNRYEGGVGDDDIYYFDLLNDHVEKDLVTSIYTIGYKRTSIQEPDIKFWVSSPSNIPAERRVRETFPLRNYVFFDLGSTELPDRYVLLKKEQVKEFKEDNLEVFKPQYLTERSSQQMIVYYNILNILGSRMEKNPTSAITLVGSSENGPDDGMAMAESVKKYLVEIFGIEASRISIEGRDKPTLPSEQIGGKIDLLLLRECDRRVSIESKAPALLMEFQSGPDAPLKPVEILDIQQVPLDSYVFFYVDGAKEALTSWSLELKDQDGIIQYFGPYIEEEMSLSGKSILKDRPEGDFKVTMIGNTKTGSIVKKEALAHMVLWTTSPNEEGLRFSVIFEFDDSKSIAIYQKYLSEIVAKKIPHNGIVIVHGYTDIIGSEDYNQTLSLKRAQNVKQIIERALLNSGRKDVVFEVYGFGENQNLSPFENKLPEERFYNRTVIIDIVP